MQQKNRAGRQHVVNGDPAFLLFSAILLLFSA
jgi:hypothetical protein